MGSVYDFQLVSEQSRDKLARRLKAARVMADKTQVEFGAALSCSRDQVADWEATGRLDAMLLPAIAEASGLSCEWLLGCEPTVSKAQQTISPVTNHNRAFASG